MTSRYDTSSSPEGQFQPGSGEQVLLNHLGITDPDEMNDVELILLEELLSGLLDEIEIDQPVQAIDLRSWHQQWLGSVYSWAGEYRFVNMQKSDFMFAAANLIPSLMVEFERKYLLATTETTTL